MRGSLRCRTQPEPGIGGAALAAAQPQEAAVQDAAIEEGVEPVPDESRQLPFGAGLVCTMKLAACCCHQAVQRRLLRAVAFVVTRGAIGRPLGLPADGLYARLPMW